MARNGAEWRAERYPGKPDIQYIVIIRGERSRWWTVEVTLLCYIHVKDAFYF